MIVKHGHAAARVSVDVVHALSVVALRHRCALAATRSPQQAPDRSAAAAARARRRRCTCRRFRSGSSRTACRSGSSSCTRCRSSQVNLLVLSGSADDPAGQVRRREPDGRDARRRRGLAIGARDRRRDRLPRRRSRRGSGMRRVGGAAARAGRAARRRAADHGRRRAAADVSRQTSSSGCASSGSRASLQARDDPPTIAALAFSRVLYGTDAPLRHGDDRHGRDDQGVHAGRSARVLRVGVPARQRRAARRRRRRRRTQCVPLLENELRRVEGAAARRAPATLPAAAAAGRRARSISSTSRARRSRRSASAGSACRARRPTTSRSR